MLIANAGYADIRGWQNIDLASWNATLAVNLTAPFLLAQQVLPGMVERRFGRILFISSVAAFSGGVVGAHYAASKAGLHGLMHHLAPRVAADGVTVNCLAPALVGETKMFPADLETGTPPVPIPVGRIGRPDEMADMAMTMLRTGYLTNKVITVDGGLIARCTFASPTPRAAMTCADSRLLGVGLANVRKSEQVRRRLAADQRQVEIGGDARLGGTHRRDRVHAVRGGGDDAVVAFEALLDALGLEALDGDGEVGVALDLHLVALPRGPERPWRDRGSPDP